MSEKNEELINTLKIEEGFPQINPETITEDEEIIEGLEDTTEITEEDRNKKTYLKITPTLYLKPILNSESDEKLFKIFNPLTNTIEVRELNELEEREVFVYEIKKSRFKFSKIKHPIDNGVDVTNITINRYGKKYKQERKRRNKLAKASRKTNRRK